MASAQAEIIKDRLRTFAEELSRAGDLTLAEVRASGERFAELTAEPDGVTWTEVDAGGIPAVWAEPGGGATDRVLEYVHGGGYVLGSAAGYRNFTGHLARATRCRVLNVDYGLAPENPHPGPVDDSVRAYRWLLDQGYRPAHLAVAGDSAGGGLALATVLKLRDDGLPQPAGAVALSPWADMEGLGQSMRTNADKDLIVTAAGLKGMADLFLGGGDARHAHASPIYGDYEGVCPLYIQVGGHESRRRHSARTRGVPGDATRVPDGGGQHARGRRGGRSDRHLAGLAPRTLLSGRAPTRRGGGRRHRRSSTGGRRRWQVAAVSWVGVSPAVSPP